MMHVSASPDHQRPFFILRLMLLVFVTSSGFWNLISDGLMAAGNRAKRAGCFRFAGVMYRATSAVCRISRRVTARCNRGLDRWGG